MTISASHSPDGVNCAAAEASLEFGRFRVVPRRRLLLAGGLPIELGTRAFELLLALLEADGALVTKGELLARVWPDVIVGQENLKVQVFALRNALGEDRDFIRTEHGRGYRFAAAVRSNVTRSTSQRPMPLRYWSTRRLFPQQSDRRAPHGWSMRIEQPRFCVHAKTTRSGEIR
jgi:DNA-binding winged helix-turn-helix (wHTH) protein